MMFHAQTVNYVSRTIENNLVTSYQRRLDHTCYNYLC